MWKELVPDERDTLLMKRERVEYNCRKKGLRSVTRVCGGLSLAFLQWRMLIGYEASCSIQFSCLVATGESRATCVCQTDTQWVAIYTYIHASMHGSKTRLHTPL